MNTSGVIILVRSVRWQPTFRQSRSKKQGELGSVLLCCTTSYLTCHCFNLCLRIRCLTLQGHAMDVLDLDWSPPSMHLLASVSIDNKVLLWDLSQCHVSAQNGLFFLV